VTGALSCIGEGEEEEEEEEEEEGVLKAEGVNEVTRVTGPRG
jgi:hypothetical protein